MDYLNIKDDECIKFYLNEDLKEGIAQPSDVVEFLEK